MQLITNNSLVETIEAEPIVSELDATHAFFLYRSHYGNEAFISSHQISDGIVGPGQWIEPSGFLSEMDKLNRPKKAKADTPAWIPYRILSVGRDHLSWLVPSGQRFMSFTEPRMRKLSGKLKAPALVFCCKPGGLHVRAVKSSSVTPSTPLYEAPFPNLYDGGRVCLGTMPKHGCLPADAERWTDAFFGSDFTHFTYQKYWSAVKAGKKPELKPTTQTIQDLLS